MGRLGLSRAEKAKMKIKIKTKTKTRAESLRTWYLHLALNFLFRGLVKIKESFPMLKLDEQNFFMKDFDVDLFL